MEASVTKGTQAKPSIGPPGFTILLDLRASTKSGQRSQGMSGLSQGQSRFRSNRELVIMEPMETVQTETTKGGSSCFNS